MTFDLIILGSGPAGLSASLYASRFGIRHLIVGKIAGGTICDAHLIDNYLGIEDVSGFELSQKMLKHAKKYQPEMVQLSAERVRRKENGEYEILLENGNLVFARTVLLSIGTRRKKAGIINEEKYLGKGVSYCATCDGFFYKNKRVMVIGGSDSAVGAAAYLSDIAERVFLLYRKGELRAEAYWKKAIENKNNIEVVLNSTAVVLQGEGMLNKVIYEQEGEEKELAINGLFIEIGSEPDMELLDGISLETDEDGYVRIGEDGSTSQPGIWSAGDITSGSNKFRQAITGAAEGAIAARSIYLYLKNHEADKRSAEK